MTEGAAVSPSSVRARVYRGCRGFTLIELIVVVFIIGIVVGAVSLSVGYSAGKGLEDEARRLAALIELAAQEAVLRGQEMALELSVDGYRFLVQDGASWEPVETEGALRPRTLPTAMHFSLYIEGEPVSLPVAAESDDEHPPTRVYFLSSGEATPFELEVSRRDVSVAYRIRAEIGGRFALEGT